MNDTQAILVAFLKSLGSPWSGYDILKSFPNIEQGEELNRPIIYIQPPFYIEAAILAQGSSNHKGRWRVDIGIWNDEKTGGKAENSIICSELNNLLLTSPTVYTSQFTVTLGTDTYTNKTLKYFGIAIDKISNMQDLSDPSAMDFRTEMSADLII
jgi:hypothetical protein